MLYFLDLFLECHEKAYQLELYTDVLGMEEEEYWQATDEDQVL